MRFSSTFDTALTVAALAHRGQLRKGTRIPYVMHPFHVSVLLSRFGHEEPLAIAGVLHDVLEDMPFEDRRLQQDFSATFPQAQWPATTDLSSFRSAVEDFLRVTFGPEVMRLVQSVTEAKNDGGPERPWIDRKREQLAHLTSAAADEATLKAADALHNVSTMIEDVRVGRATLEGRFKATPEQTLWYYREVARLTRERAGDLPIVRALHAAVADLAMLIGTQ
jgi:(p)ppGpp synthase/HD superfamily hydrolase